MEKYLFLYLKTGGGHLSVAKSIASYLNKNNPENVDPVLVDGFGKVNKAVKYIIEDGYRISQTRAVWIFEFFYWLTKINLVAKLYASIISAFTEPWLKQVIFNERPDKIIIFHFFLNQPVIKVVKKFNLQIPVVTIVTDPFTVPPIWLLNKDHNYVVFSDEALETSKKKRVLPEKVKQFPFIIDDKFSSPLPMQILNQVKEIYGFNIDKKVILLMGGGDGIPKGKAIILNLLKAGFDANIAIVCGRDKDLYDYATKLGKEYKRANLKIYGFVDFVYDLMNISDLIITKGGPSTIMEILALKKVPLINSYIWEQEKGNMEFVIKNHLGLYENNPKKIPALIRDLIENHKFLRNFIDNRQNFLFQSGTSLVSDYIMNFR